MKTIKIEKIDDLKTFVEGMELDTKYIFPDTCRYEWAYIEKDTKYNSSEVCFCWVMEYNYAVAGTVGYIHPLTGNYVTEFKTEKGAKRNLLKRLLRVFPNERTL